MKVAILYNARPAHPVAGLPDDAFEEYDSPDTIAAIAAALARIGVAPVPVVADQRLPWRLDEGRLQLFERHRPDVVFNLLEAPLGRPDLESHAVALLEWLGVRFTGCGSQTLALCRRKDRVNAVLHDAGIPVP